MAIGALVYPTKTLNHSHIYSNMYNIIQLNDKSLPELQAIAQELGIKKTDAMKKEELVYKILDEQAIAGATKKVAADKLKEERKVEKQKRTRTTKKGEADKTAPKDETVKNEAAAETASQEQPQTETNEEQASATPAPQKRRICLSPREKLRLLCLPPRVFRPRRQNSEKRKIAS